MSEKKLKSLEEYERDRLARREAALATGIACPKCGQELFDHEFSTMVMTFPPQRACHCRACNYSTSRYI